jgi:rare lipoprotein A
VGLLNTMVLISVIGASNVGENSSTRLEQAHPEPAIQLANNNTERVYAIRSLSADKLLITQAQTTSGKASWYGSAFHGNLTANGERFNQNALTAAHKTLPFGCKVKVTNIANGRSVMVRINDRGPFVGGRIIDLSRAAADQIGMLHAGTAGVRLSPSC